MEDNQNPQMSVTQALNQIQSWLNAKEFEKVIQGCQEILEIEPGNQRALTLMKQAEEGRHNQQAGPVAPEETPEFSKLTKEAAPEPAPAPAPEPEPAPAPAPAPAPQPTPEPEPEPPTSAPDPLAQLHVESKPEMFDDHHYEDFGEDDGDRKKLFLAMLIPAVIVVIVGGGIIWYLSSQDRVDEIDDIIVDDTTETDTNYLEDNEDRVDALTLMAKALEEYEALNEEYPSIKEVESVIEDSNYFDKIPVDARQGEFDKAGKLMGYTYAVYDTIAGDDTAYIVSALFEDSRGFGYAWTRGASTKNYTDYRDVEENHVTLIGSDDDDIGTYEPEPEPETNDDEDNDDDSSTMGPKVPQ